MVSFRYPRDVSRFSSSTFVIHYPDCPRAVICCKVARELDKPAAANTPKTHTYSTFCNSTPSTLRPSINITGGVKCFRP